MVLFFRKARGGSQDRLRLPSKRPNYQISRARAMFADMLDELGSLDRRLEKLDAQLLRLSSDPKDPTSWPLTTVLRTKLGLTLISWKTGEERVYRIVENEVSSMRKGALRSDARLT
jgi:hypothetical protein